MPAVLNYLNIVPEKYFLTNEINHTKNKSMNTKVVV